MIKQQRILIIALVACFAVFVAAYFIVVRPLIQDPENTPETVTPEVGEEVVFNSTIMMFPQVPKNNISSIEIKNEHGGYTLKYNETVDDFTIVGYESLAFSSTKFSELVVAAGYPITIRKLTDKATETELREYGFEGEDSVSASYTLTTRTGVTHTVYIGHKLVTGGAYYAMYKGRDAIYVITSEIEGTLLAPVEDMVTPLLTAGVPLTTYYNIDNFAIKHYGEDYIVCRKKTADELETSGSTAIAEAVTVHPEGYSMSMEYDTVLQTLASYEGESVAAIGLSKENLEKYGLSDEPYTISYEYDGFKFKLVASELTDGYYYVSTSMFNIIVKVPEADFAFLKWDHLGWIEPRYFNRSIRTVSEIDISGGDVKETFHFYHHPNDDPNLTVVGDNCGEIRDVTNFRGFYTTLLLSRLEDYAPEDVVPDESRLMLKYKVTTTGGEVTEYAFYRYSAGRCLLTINGEGEFYVYDDTVNKIISDADKAMKGIEIDAYDRS